MKKVSRDKVIYIFSPKHMPVKRVRLGELVLIETQDAFGSQIKTENDSVNRLDWSKVDGATGPIYVETARPGDTLVAEILNINVSERGVIVTVPGHGILARRKFKPVTRVVAISKDHASFEKIRIRSRPMIGTIGVTPSSGEVPCGSLGEHGGNMDVKELTAGTRLYLPVFVEGALFAAGDIHAAQADGELCVSAIEVPGEILLRFSLVRERKPRWPVLETTDSYALLACGGTLDEAAVLATQAAVEAFMREYNWPFETAYMFGSLAVSLEINQVVDPKRGVRAVISKDLVSLSSLLF